MAAGLNIAGFNSGIALGSWLGGVTFSTVGVAYMGVTGAVISVLGLVLLFVQMAKSRGVGYRATVGVSQ